MAAPSAAARRRASTVRVEDGGREEGVAAGRHDQAEVHQPAEEELGVREDAADVAGGDGARCDVGALVVGELAGVFGN
jgi:hypothetical protein